MKNVKWSELVSTFLIPVLLTCVGVMLLVDPNAATALVSKILGWGCIGCGVVTAVTAIANWPVARISRIITTAVLVLLGGYLVRNPLALAVNFSLFLGLFLLITGLSNLKRTNLLVTVATLGAGIVLLINPLALTQTLFRICGIVLLVVGIANIVSRVRVMKRLAAAEDPDIIDAEP